MTRIRSGAIPMFASEPPAERVPGASPSSPFRAALTAARKTERAPRRDDERAAQDQAAERMAAAQPRATARSTASPTDRRSAPGAEEARTDGASAAEPAIDLPYVIAHSALSGPIGGAGKLGARPAGAQAAAFTAATADAALATASGAVAPNDATGAAGAAQAQSGAPHDDSPIAALLAAAVGRAIGSFRRTAPGSAPDAPADPSAAPAPSAAADSGFEPAAAKITPLEQAVHDLIGQFTARDRSDEHDRPSSGGSDLELAGFPAFGAPHAAAAAPAIHDAAAPASETARAAPSTPPAPAEPPANPSHVHLVLDDGPERVVVTVAMRGSDVHVALRANDEATSAALARNAASLDHAMRARGLALGELTTERGPRDRRPHHGSEPRDQRPDAEPFELEETP